MVHMTETDANQPESTTTPPAAPPAGGGGGDLAALQAQIDAAAKTGGAQATAELVKTLGFGSADEMTQFIAAQRKAIEDGKTEEQRRLDAAEAAQKAAEAREAEADNLIRQGVVNLALVRAGVDPANVAAAAPLVQLGDEVTEEAADAAVATVKANPAFASLFAPAPAGAPSGKTDHPANERTSGAVKTAYDRGVEEYRRLHPVKSA